MKTNGFGVCVLGVCGLLALVGTLPTALALEVGEVASCAEVSILSTDDSLKTECPLTLAASVPTTVKYKYLEFSQTTCGPCIANFPVSDALVSQFSDRMVGLTIFLDRNASVSQTYVKNNRKFFHHDVVIDNTRAFTKIFTIVGTPTQFILDASDRVVYKHIGGLTSHDLKEIEKIVTQ